MYKKCKLISHEINIFYIRNLYFHFIIIFQHNIQRLIHYFPADYFLHLLPSFSHLYFAVHHFLYSLTTTLHKQNSYYFELNSSLLLKEVSIASYLLNKMKETRITFAFIIPFIYFCFYLC